MELNREQAIEILEKFDMFQGQRAGRELWQDKPFKVQEQDIADFSRDVNLLIGYIKELTEEVANLQEKVEAYRIELGETRVALAEANNDKKELAEENKRLHVALNTDISIVRMSRGSGKTAHLREVGRIRVDAIRANAVREMRSRIKSRCIEGGIYPAFVERVIDQIEKEMLEATDGKDNP